MIYQYYENEEEEEQEYDDNKMFLIQLQGKQVEKTLPENTVLFIQSVSYGIKAPCKNSQVVTLQIKNEDEEQVISRLIPNKIESQQIQLQIPGVSHSRKLIFNTYSQNSELEDIDIVGMLYQQDDEIIDDNEDNQKLRNYGIEEEEEQSMSQEEEQPLNNQQSQFQEQFYRDIVQARTQEHKLDRSMNLTKVDYKDEVVGTGRVADRDSVVTILYELYDQNNKLIQKNDRNTLLTVSLQDDNMSKGMKQIIVGMREGGIRIGTGPYEEIIGEGSQEMLRAKIQLFKSN